MATVSVERTASVDLLWTNTSPSNFAPQTIPLDLSGYDAVKIACCFIGNPTGTNDIVNVVEIPVGSRGAIFCYYLLKDNTSDAAHFMNGCSRVTTVTTTGVTFEHGQMVYSGNAYVDWDSRATPWKIWGVKYN